ncbi:MAG: hypothetical protein WCK15_14900 [Pirellula sp.]
MSRNCAPSCLAIAACVSMVLHLGCATWLPTGEEPNPIKHGFVPTPPSPEAAGIETILVRLDQQQSQRLPELWAQIDEQVLAPELRIALDRNGMRAGKLSANLPLLLEDWIRETVRRIGEDPLEQTGFAADISSFSQLWRCRANSRKELTLRKFATEPATVFYVEGTTKARTYDSPHFLYSIQAAPRGDSSATIRLTPELQYGDPIRKVIAREAAIRTDMRRESVAWEKLTIDLKIQHGECILIGPTSESRGLGEHYFHTKTQNGDIQPVLLLVRLSESNLDDSFARK